MSPHDEQTADSTLSDSHDLASVQLRDIISALIAEAVIVVDQNRRIRFVNQAGARMGGVESAHALVTADAEAIVDHWDVRDDSGRPLDFDALPLARALAGHANRQILHVRRSRTDDDHIILCSATPLHNAAGHVELAVVVIRDLTARRRAEEGQRFLAEASAVLCSSLDYPATLRTVAGLAVPRLADAFGVYMRAADGGLVTLARSHIDGNRVMLTSDRDAVEEVLESGQPSLAPDGRRSTLMVPITGTHGTMGVITLIASESGRRYGRADLALATQLAGRVALAIDNSLLCAEVRQAVSLRDDFLSVAGHELRTPLTALQLQLQGLMRAFRRTEPLPREQLEERLEKATRNVMRLSRLVSELLDVSRIATGRMVMHKEPVDLAQLASEVVDRFSDDPQRGRSSITIEQSGSTLGHWDRLRLDQLLTKLVGNACKYGAGGAVTVAVTGLGDGRVRLAVRDRGIGINPEIQARVFGRFERGVSVRHYGGLGLGLWIARQIVEAHDGTIALHSQPGVGTTVTIELPSSRNGVVH
jgi:signal transduction histidine kinase